MFYERRAHNINPSLFDGEQHHRRVASHRCHTLRCSSPHVALELEAIIEIQFSYNYLANLHIHPGEDCHFPHQPMQRIANPSLLMSTLKMDQFLPCLVYLFVSQRNDFHRSLDMRKDDFLGLFLSN